jgi:hypothetical protein
MDQAIPSETGSVTSDFPDDQIDIGGVGGSLSRAA